MSAAVAAASGSAAPDPRLATTDELQAFIDEMKPEDFDVTSPEFRDLPTEAQYEIIGDLRLRSRQTSYKRLQQMLRAAPTPIDFSREQIKALSQRNSLTMQLLETTGIINDAHVPVRIASERSRQYTLVRSEGADGGWVLGRISDEGSFIKPIKIDITEEEEQRRARDAALDDDSDDMDMEEVVVYVWKRLHM
jgi:DNA excision repair protein ERCC-5